MTLQKQYPIKLRRDPSGEVTFCHRFGGHDGWCTISQELFDDHFPELSGPWDEISVTGWVKAMEVVEGCYEANLHKQRRRQLTKKRIADFRQGAAKRSGPRGEELLKLASFLQGFVDQEELAEAEYEAACRAVDVANLKRDQLCLQSEGASHASCC